jgi:hypothetical protein
MNKLEALEETLTFLKAHLQESEKMWENLKDPAYIAGYLKGTIEISITKIENIAYLK